MPKPGNIEIGTGWHSARERLRQLEAAAERMSPVWFAGNAAVIASAAVFLATALILGISLFQVQEFTASATRNQTALFESMTLQEALDEMGATTRSFAFERSDPMLAARDAAKHSIRESLARLAGSVRGDAKAEAQVREIRGLSARRIELFDDLIAMVKAQTPAARIQAGEAERLRLARAVNASLSNFRNTQTAALGQAQERIHLNMQFASWLVLFAGFTAPVFGLFGIRLLRRVKSDSRTRELQMELMHVQRLAIMGETSAMLAHEINQPLTAASNYLAVLRRHLESGAADKALPFAERISQQIQRAGSILKKLRRFIEKRESEHSLEAPEGLVEDAITLIGTIDDTVVLTTRIGQNLPRVMVDRVQLQQVLVNLMRNAIEAMAGSTRRDIVLTVQSSNDASVEISLADSGPGLPQEVVERLFQPFVSTKTSGMGVGLSICHSIISQHGGRIWAEPNPGGGTVFHFTLPAAEERAVA